LANLPKDKEPHVVIMDLDYWIIKKCKFVCSAVWSDFQRYNFQTGMRTLLDFLIEDVSGIYMNAAKDRLYCDTGHARQHSAQTALREILIQLIHTLAPILTYTVEEVLDHAPVWLQERMPHVFALPQHSRSYGNSTQGKFVEGYWKEALKEFNALFDTLKQKGLVKDPLEVVVVRDTGEATEPGEIPASFGLTIQQEAAVRKELDPGPVPNFGGAADFLGVSQLDSYEPVEDENYLGSFTVKWAEGREDEFKLFKSRAEKCPRCWKRAAQGELCARCEEIVNGLA
jgi:isoleucyl-tRNA synthetase